MSYEAMMFARQTHATQKRLYSGAPYIEHLAEVAALTQAFGGDDVAINGAWLHDCIEDQGITAAELSFRFTPEISRIVFSLSDTEIGTRASRLEQSLVRLSNACYRAQLIKACDIISNTKSVEQMDKDFAELYLSEKLRQLKHLRLAPTPAITVARESIAGSLEWLHENTPATRARR